MVALLGTYGFDIYFWLYQCYVFCPRMLLPLCSKTLDLALLWI